MKRRLHLCTINIVNYTYLLYPTNLSHISAMSNVSLSNHNHNFHISIHFHIKTHFYISVHFHISIPLNASQERNFVLVLNCLTKFVGGLTVNLFLQFHLFIFVVFNLLSRCILSLAWGLLCYGHFLSKF